MLLGEMDCPFSKPFASAESLQKMLSRWPYPRDLTMGDLYKNMFPHWQKEIIHGMIEFVVVGIVSISA